MGVGQGHSKHICSQVSVGALRVSLLPSHLDPSSRGSGPLQAVAGGRLVVMRPGFLMVGLYPGSEELA